MRKTIIFGLVIIILSLFTATSIKWLKFDNDILTMETINMNKDLTIVEASKRTKASTIDVTLFYAERTQYRYRKLKTNFLCYEYQPIDTLYTSVFTKP